MKTQKNKINASLMFVFAALLLLSFSCGAANQQDVSSLKPKTWPSGWLTGVNENNDGVSYVPTG